MGFLQSGVPERGGGYRGYVDCRVSDQGLGIPPIQGSL